MLEQRSAVGALTISLDLELLWGVRDHSTRESYGANILGGREAVPWMLDLFSEFNIRATWATVGALFAESKEELLAFAPDPKMRPLYDQPALSNYAYLNDVGETEAADPYYFGYSLIQKIQATHGQEIATHTFSHYYCLEPGQMAETFGADMQAAVAIATAKGIQMSSIVFPRNQYDQRHIDICARFGITNIRRNPDHWAYRPKNGSSETKLRRAARLLDAYSGVLGPHLYGLKPNGYTQYPASRFLRPNVGRLSTFHPAHIRVITRNMTQAAKQGKGFHLWWHPHNFGQNLDDNLLGLRQVLMHYKKLNSEFGMKSKSMYDLSRSL